MSANTNPFRKAREDHAMEVFEDYAEVILRLAGGEPEPKCEEAGRVRTVNIARELGVAQPTVTKTLTRMERDGLVCIHPRQFVHLTKNGEEVARNSRERHELVVRFLLQLGVSAPQAALDAEGLEHHLSGETLDAIRRFVLGGGH